MTAEEINIAIAEHCGVISCDKWSYFALGMMAKNDCGHEGCVASCFWPPKYSEDLNAMHEAEKNLGEKWPDYYIRLVLACPEDKRQTLFSPAPVRAEAFLRTVGRWVE